MSFGILVGVVAAVIVLGYAFRRQRGSREGPHDWWVGGGSAPYLPPGADHGRQERRSDRPFMPRKPK